MKLNADFENRAIVHSADMPWTPSPMAGVSRRMLDRIGEEVARATSIVRYDAGSQFSSHVHSGGEEFLVLEGVFQDEHGDFPEGTYVRNPINTEHTPASAPGCEIFVKLWQFDPREKDILRIDTNDIELVADPANSKVTTSTLFSDTREEVLIQQWEAGATVALQDAGGIELLVIDGEFSLNGECFKRHSWLRLPKKETAACISRSDGTRVWMKKGHLNHISTPTS